ncbi:tyrosine-type recombinase/integrase [Streptomyces sp. NPDC055912]|uniref:tyrosine-type recombinase/integrase n=1 Tax=Streptomyces sp. NPDC055912 TaxID=3345660 RepID=UPI0035D5687C
MSGNLAKVIDIYAEPTPDLNAWEGWLRSQLAEDWRPGEWDAATMLFTGDVENPRTVAWRCITEGCTTVQKARNGRCTACGKAFRASGLSEEEFNITARREPNRSYTDVDTCSVERDGFRCPREYHSTGLCRVHSLQWIKAARAAIRKKPFDGTLEEWMRDVAVPFEARLDECLVIACTLEQVAVHSGLCRVHSRRWKDHRGAVDHMPDLSDWIAHETPYLSVHQFSLAPMSELGRLEMLYAVQQRDMRNHNVDPNSTRQVVQRLAGVPSLLLAEPEVFVSSIPSNTSVAAVMRDVVWTIKHGHDQFMGIKPTDKLVWDMKAVGHPTAHRKDGPRGNRSGTVDFSVIKQPWLREAVMEWARSTRPDSTRFRRHLLACTVTSTVLGRLPGGGMDPAALRFAEMNLVVDAIRALRKEDGDLQTSSNRGAQLAALFAVLDFGRSAGLLDDLHGTFSRHSSHRIVREESNEDEIGKAIPESVIHQLDSHLEELGRDFPYRGYAAADIAAMLQAAYRVLRDTGRRPREVMSLKWDCLEFADNDCFLVWNNYKSKRHRRRLPITRETASDLQAWAERREGLNAPARSGAYLFPAVTDTSRYAHMETGTFSRAVRLWVQSLEAIHSEGTGSDGLPVPFDRDKIFPYAFRHSYAQRHADAGTPIDVLKELMDHRSADTTARYYKVSLKRKQEAVKSMRLRVVDRHGNPAPITSNKAYEMRSVAVPFGGCTEPSNVKAGGQACPIRFQCAGCGFYRPDPSYLAAIEDQIRDLKADKETALAMDTAEYVVRNLQDQIDSFRKIAANMHEQIAELPESEREELMESVKVLRKSRAARGRMLPLTVIKRGESSA